MDEKQAKYFLITSCLLLFVFIFVLFISFFLTNNKCNDGALNNRCSKIQPYFCENGKLIEKASVCGCLKNNYGINYNIKEDKCVFSSSNPKIISLNYILRGKKGNISFEVYPEILNLSLNYKYPIESGFDSSNFKLQIINNSIQREALLPLIIKIQNITSNKYDQARIAISLVQNIPYKESNRSIFVAGSLMGYRRTPYEVLYENQGVCGEKSLLLVFLLKELGFGSSMFYFSKENHEAVGIKCTKDMSFYDTDFCFIETTGPSIITDSENDYLLGVKLSSNPQITLISEGISFNKNLYEFKDARLFIKLREELKKSSSLNIFDSLRLKNLIKKYGISNIYFSI
ncbi:hypothetical protein GYA25_00110 [Candidatus Woesearchaeota archaeon]|nr:hypothetical protein [Candidatus Woesearchaeota archaeon]